MIVKPLKKPFSAELSQIASDKSISHRCAIFSLLCNKASRIKNYLSAEDTLNTLNIIIALGAKVEVHENGALRELKLGDSLKLKGLYINELIITPPEQIKEPACVLECGNSGTAMRLFLGLLSACKGHFILSGDEFLNTRPMKRVSAPLTQVGAKIDGRDDGERAPISIRGDKLKYFKFKSQISSAQVKTALILAGLLSEGCEFSESELSRDHTEKMLLGMQAPIKIKENSEIAVSPLKTALKPLEIEVPNDPSSAFFYAVAAAIIPDAKIVLKNMLLNKTRIEAYKVLEKMGAKIKFVQTSTKYESIGDIEVAYAPLKAVKVSENISWLIDEAPALAIAFACADGTSELTNAKELRVKESDRIAVSVAGLRACGIEASELEDGFMVTGGRPKQSIIDSHGDHRIAMSFAILGLLCGMEIKKSEFIATSFPNFSEILRDLGASVED
ncbi:3-phosphoshikimate 1-carboxyvinyltransferase [Campylobacter sp. 19-13652]|uniref:3-phosphoshikimate 1-carboxyvinyltransferase n=1 Tax=Campylobacter sp. 19-13652 TaxID=2840180 RepID=UPI001C76A71F|nr:3-phosphoshikimate 1-carboxyvinyltransferase [Campylobacter sp. 19-13652]BCX78979.1 3-phosphoshikimate 1-carboxyvinyltransferase [Campylobacter sp. 19-13652]